MPEATIKDQPAHNEPSSRIAPSEPQPVIVERSVDGAGRVLIPTDICQMLGESFLLYGSTTRPEIELLKTEAANRKVKAFEWASEALSSPEQRAVKRLLCAGLTEVMTDKGGRLNLSAHCTTIPARVTIVWDGQSDFALIKMHGMPTQEK